MGSGSSDKQFIFYPVFQSVCNLDIRELNLILIYPLVINSQFKEFSMFKNQSSLQQYLAFEPEANTTLLFPEPPLQPKKQIKYVDKSRKRQQAQKFRRQYASISKIEQKGQLQKKRLILTSGTRVYESQRIQCNQEVAYQRLENAAFHRSHKVQCYQQAAYQTTDNQTFHQGLIPSKPYQTVQNTTIHKSQQQRCSQKQTEQSEGGCSSTTNSYQHLTESEQLILILATMLGLGNSHPISSILPVSCEGAQIYLQKNLQRITNRLMRIFQCPESNKDALFQSRNPLLGTLLGLFGQKYGVKFEGQSNEAEQSSTLEIQKEKTLLFYRWNKLQQE